MEGIFHILSINHASGDWSRLHISSSHTFCVNNLKCTENYQILIPTLQDDDWVLLDETEIHHKLEFFQVMCHLCLVANIGFCWTANICVQQ